MPTSYQTQTIHRFPLHEAPKSIYIYAKKYAKGLVLFSFAVVNCTFRVAKRGGHWQWVAGWVADGSTT